MPRFRGFAVSLLALGIGALPAASCRPASRAGGAAGTRSRPAASRAAAAVSWQLQLAVAPAVAPVGRPARFTLTVTGAAGRPVTGARARVELTMVSMDMGTTLVPLRESSPGRYTGQGAFAMGGDWNCRAVVRRGSRTQEQTFPCRAGE